MTDERRALAEPMRVGIKAAVTWLLARAREMNDPNAKAVLNSAAFSLGQENKYRESELVALAALPPAGDDAVLDSYAEENQRLSDQLEAAIATLSQERAAIGWRDISTAPKDGTRVDLWCAPTRFISTGAARVADCWFSQEKWWMYDESTNASDPNNCRTEVHNATHWMPLPPAPQRTGE